MKTITVTERIGTNQYTNSYVINGNEVVIKVPTSGWTGSAKPFSQTITNSGIISGATIGLAMNGTSDSMMAVAKAAGLTVSSISDGSVTLKANNAKPTADLYIVAVAAISREKEQTLQASVTGTTLVLNKG